LSPAHQVLQTAFGSEDAHLHRFGGSSPFAPLRPVDGEYYTTVAGSDAWTPRSCTGRVEHPDLRSPKEKCH